jgi:hypothetical protein
MSEEKYIEVEGYINLRDKVQGIEAQKKEYTDIVNKLKVLEDANDTDAVNSVVEEYLRR